jgi:transcriptional regulator with XRE-family HTH domain
MNTRISPTVRKRRLATELRRLRDDAGIKASDVAQELGCSPGKISQMETGRVSITVPDTKAMLELYGVNGHQRETLVELARAARQRGWWAPFSEVMHPWLERYVGMETETSGQLIYQAHYVPGLLQTEAYHRTLRARDLRSWSELELERLIALHLARQGILLGANPPRFWFVLDEAALRRLVGSPEIMSGQLRRLLEAGQQDNISIRVLPFSAGAHGAMSGSFTLLEFPEPIDPDVVHIEYVSGAFSLEGDEEVAIYRHVFDDLMASALSQTRSAELIRAIAAEL